jgi:hypothetical protein
MAVNANALGGYLRGRRQQVRPVDVGLVRELPAVRARYSDAET